ncbi:DUF4268 domain-containing protein [Niabella hibiscisoli]|uniref:DUF4268 domain-containing protein n=1 Tax=Niabella hibiscisoli TaxID=1825928 RepID=UPI001F105C1B|nr:DUF4268 domain-containing protein [Niabella hibiscisoli]MCH5718811.1 DUF4268 domain-containing protein [Niabella hibiscisoli]
MYSKSEASNIKKEFWTKFGLYMKPVKNAEHLTINWINYKTGIRHIYFRMDASKREATIAIEIKHPDAASRALVYEQMELLKGYLEGVLGESWIWQPNFYDEDGSSASRIFMQLEGVNVFDKEHWPVIISFLRSGSFNSIFSGTTLKLNSRYKFSCFFVIRFIIFMICTFKKMPNEKRTYIYPDISFEYVTCTGNNKTL